ncbi:hypothetical protein BDR26DRAFT_143594 [Obelidium mucronatum]|nr:hypothetical protein BDR26DRAFT_143594 [Obelidium mucronatum]
MLPCLVNQANQTKQPKTQIAAAKRDRNSAQLVAATAQFRAFLDEALVFYATLVLRLAAGHGLGHVRRQMAAASLRLPAPVLPVAAHVAPADKAAVAYTCFQCIIYLGDLARYRDSTTPNSSPLPKFYYTLAHKLIPTSGNPFNQLAVLPPPPATGDLVPAELYVRALCCRRPFGTARKNLEVCLGKSRPIEGTDGVLEACRALLLGATSGSECLISSMMRICLQCGTLRLLKVQMEMKSGASTGREVFGYKTPLLAVSDVVAFLRILCLHIIKQVSLTGGTCPLDSAVEFWELVASFCNALQCLLPAKYHKVFFEKKVDTSVMLDLDLIGFLAVDGRLFEVNEMGECQDSDFKGAEAADDDTDDEESEEAGAGDYRKSIHVLWCFYEMSRASNVPLTFTGAEWKAGNASNHEEGETAGSTKNPLKTTRLNKQRTRSSS